MASGLLTVLGSPLNILGSEAVTRLVTEELEGMTGGRFAFEPDAVKAADLIVEHIDRKRAALKLRPMMHEPPPPAAAILAAATAPAAVPEPVAAA